MTTYEFEVAAKNAVIAAVKERYHEDYQIQDVQIVWMARILGFMKTILIDNGGNARLYEVTYNRERNEMYVDMYSKDKNVVAAIDTEVHG